MDQRPDPIQLIVRPSDSVAKHQQQVFGAWIHLARKAGWQVVPLNDEVDWLTGECGVVDVEGLRYLIRVGLRSRSRVMVVPDEHVGTHVADAALERRSFRSEPILALTAWAEPMLS
ncbi:hypothetical protein [Actinoplanes regularis]|uniref:hypothetical protein n=1 Tax=Actinoplanes regularis TaxID=52697 RepID=UPI0024A1CD7A|nr:hypothetical protein [Actinoplanes regularis]GLW29384.1 hypothetical protein Areg01_23240 [Actinoplanes regularis]